MPFTYQASASGFSGCPGAGGAYGTGDSTTFPAQIDAYFYDSNSGNYVSARVYLAPIISEILALILGRVSSSEYHPFSGFSGFSGIQQGDVVRIGGDHYLLGASGTDSTSANVFGFCRSKPTGAYSTYPLFVGHFQRYSQASGFSGTAGNDVFLGNNGQPSTSAGTVSVKLGKMTAWNECMMNALPAGTASGFSGFSGKSGLSGLSGFSGFSGL